MTWRVSVHLPQCLRCQPSIPAACEASYWQKYIAFLGTALTKKAALWVGKGGTVTQFKGCYSIKRTI